MPSASVAFASVAIAGTLVYPLTYHSHVKLVARGPKVALEGYEIGPQGVRRFWRYQRNEGRIANGVEVEPKFKYPFIVRIWDHLLHGGKNRSECAGTVLNREWILTAAHCIRRTGDSHIFTVGDHNIHEKEENEQDLRVKEIIIHEGYREIENDNSGNWDIAVVRVEPPIRFSNQVSPINLPSCKQKPSYPEVTAIGWGKSSHPDPFTPFLMEGNVTIVAYSECFGDVSKTKHVICTRHENGTYAAHGDSGGPIFQLKEKGNIHSGYVQLGVANGYTGPMERFVFYADVAPYVGWIHRRISGCGNHPFNKFVPTNITHRPPPTFPSKPTETAKPFK